MSSTMGCTNSLRINRFSLEELVVDKIRSFLPAHIERITDAVCSQQRFAPKEQRFTKARIERLKQEAQNLLTLISQRKYEGYALEQAKARYEEVCGQIDASEAKTANMEEEVLPVRYDAAVIRRVMDNLPKAMSLNREAGQQLMRTIVGEVLISNEGPRAGQCPLCDKEFQKLTVIHTRQHGYEREEFFRKFPTVGFTHRAQISMRFNAIGISSEEKIVTVDFRGALKLQNDHFDPVVFSL